MRVKKYDILVVEDDEDDRLILKEVFDTLHYGDRVSFFDSGFSFLHLLPKIRLLVPPPLLILLDYHMPGANGDALLTSVKQDQQLQAVPVVMYSTGMSPHLQDECLLAGAQACFEKKSTYHDTVAFVRQLCEYAYGKTPRI